MRQRRIREFDGMVHSDVGLRLVAIQSRSRCKTCFYHPVSRPREAWNRVLKNALVTLVAVLPLMGCGGEGAGPSSRIASSHLNQPSRSRAVKGEAAVRAALDARIWATELQAQEHEECFVKLWDALRASNTPWRVLSQFECDEIRLPSVRRLERVDYGVDVMAAGKPHQTLSSADWQQRIADWHQAGFRLVESEWHHERFQSGESGETTSTVRVVLHVENPAREERWIVRGDLLVTFKPAASGASPQVGHVDATSLQAFRRRGPVPFRLAATLPLPDSAGRELLALYDLDHDGDAEIVFGRHRYRNEGGGKFVAERLRATSDEIVTAGVLGDFDLDGHVDLFCAEPGSLPAVFLADATGRFSQEPLIIDAAGAIQLAIAPTAGDVDGDGDLDVWLSQYKPPYRGGQMPTPYFDANDGYPSTLLINEGQGTFRDNTLAAGLAAKRHRRTYSSSLVDLDQDRDLDLLVVSDFAGVDVYENDGRGVFRDVTPRWIDEPHNFGMSHVLDDFDADGRTDIFVAGMGSTTARRLDRMGIGREDFAEHNRMRGVMGYGNRMYLATGDGYAQPDFRDSVARTGWSWGSASADFDNDADVDLFVANGHISGRSARDYCSVFWRHDIYTGSSIPDPELGTFFRQLQDDFQQTGSWNGFEHNCLLVNRGPGGFINLAFLLGAAAEFDSRNAVATDIDSDGNVDLMVVENSPARGSVLHVIRNHAANANRWIGVRIVDLPGRSNLGGQVTLLTDDGRRRTRPIVSGDSFSSQHPAAVHFGLGPARKPLALEVEWVDGTRAVLETPAMNQYHLVRD